MSRAPGEYRARERAVLSESTDDGERAEQMESTVSRERAAWLESTEPRERAASGGEYRITGASRWI